ncbi:Glutamate synthase (NADPH) [Catenulispora acidiphila DSM 44928]|uniref:Glutamate synthase (NADPH) n=1 Tax=Catenulispora acidiphila (strain DSM 44928 / JCM 14897 / NBRC 102108 / NRRL B-24433 / ID139908) TaxID=479433 RepID=C7Q8Z3_CATAD|nr:FMN-binding glutamate synthase family protein [Catenulispora acidiphila]ACU72313.1 Glutamate synthase (NADPH) [Catenulispora acidiphila DSM 44928]
MHVRLSAVSVPVAMVLVTAASVWATVAVSLWWLFALVPFGALAVVAIYDVVQRRHSILRNFPLLGHMRYLLEAIRPEMQQYFIERDYDGRPFDRDTRTVVYEQSKGIHEETSFGTELDVNQAGYEYVEHATVPLNPDKEQPRVRIGGPDCTQPYDMAMLNVSAMSFGSLSANAIRALNAGAARGGFAHDTGEGGLTPYHLEGGGDLVWEIGSGYFSVRTRDGDFDPEQFRDKVAHPHVKCAELKLSQGAKPGLGGVLPGAKVTAEIARFREVPEGEKCISPPAHKVFETPRELVLFMAKMRELADGKPVGFKLCVGRRSEFLAICKAMVAEGVTPDFIVVDGAEGGTGAAPLEFQDGVGQPLTDGLMIVHNALVGTGLRDRIRIGASGKVATGMDIVKRVAMGADYTNSARAMMMAAGCIQARMCHTNRCPVGVATQDPARARALDVADKTERVRQFQQNTVAQAQQIIAAMGLRHPDELRPGHLLRRIDQNSVRTYAELFEWLEPGELLSEAPQGWAADWRAANADRFTASV